MDEKRRNNNETYIGSSSAQVQDTDIFSQMHPRFPSHLNGLNNTGSKGIGMSMRGDSSQFLVSPAKYRNSCMGYVRDWIQEVIFLLLCTLSLLGVFLVLILSRDKPQPRLPFAISLNTVVSYLGVIYKAGLLGAVTSCIGQLKWCWYRNPRGLEHFDILDAVSRSPLTAFMIFFSFKPYRWIYLGAFIMLLTAIVDPFLQQTISLSLTHEPLNVATIPRAQGYDAGSDLADLNQSVQGRFDFGLKAAMYQGLFAPQDSSEIKKSCPSGNCTYPVFDSLAFCSRCTNLTGSVKTNDNPLFYGAENPIPANYTFNVPVVGPITINTFTYAGSIEQGPALVSVPFPTNLSLQAVGIANPLVAFTMLHWGLTDTTMNGNMSHAGNYSIQPPEAFQCALYFCLNTYQVDVSDGICESNVTSTYAPLNGTFWGNDSLNEFFNAEDLIITRPASSPVTSGNATFYVPSGTVGILATYLEHFFTGYQSLTAADGIITELPPPNPQTAFAVTDSPLPFLNDTMAVFSNQTYVNVPAIMAGMATTMTNYIRLAGTGQLQQDTLMEGTSQVLQPLIRVDWRWISLPAALVVFGIAFLIYTIVVSAKLGVPAWKDGALAMLFHGLDEATSRSLHATHEGNMTARQMTRIAKKTNVILEAKMNGEMNLVER